MNKNSSDTVKSIPFTRWKWKENRRSYRVEANHVDKRLNKDEFNIRDDYLLSYEENLKWESVLVSEALQETRKRKFFAINSSMILFPGLVGGFLGVISALEKIDTSKGLIANPHSWIILVIISIFIGMANMIAIKYIAAYKSQANLFIRQLNCLRQARDSITYYKFEGKYPISLKELIEPSIYYKVFGKHRKLYIGNEELRNRMDGSFSDSADKSLIGFLFVTSTTLISAPFICLSAILIDKWDQLAVKHIPYLDTPVSIASVNLILLTVAISIFITGHWKNFKKLRTYYKNEFENEKTNISEVEIFKTKWTDYISRFIISILAIYWMYLSFYLTEEITIFSVFMVALAMLSLLLILICINKVFFDSLNRIHKSIVYKLDYSINNVS